MSLKRGVAVLGSTGTIGQYTLDIIERYPEQFEVVSLACGKNIEKLKTQIQKFKPQIVSVDVPSAVKELESLFPNVEFCVGSGGVKRCIEAERVEVAIVGIVGFAGLEPTLQAIRANKIVGLANKESLVVAGTLIKAEIEKSKSFCVPVDSEHNAIYQLLQGRDRGELSSIVLTASGGPLLKYPEMRLEDVTPEFAVKHPKWKMGPKISVDSATLMNKGLEVVEAHFIFGIPEKLIEVWVHPQSIVHGAIWLKDNSCLAQLTTPDMKSSIGLALRYPNRLDKVIEKMSFKEMAKLEFFEPDMKRFPCLRLAREALLAGPSYLVTLNAANEIAVDAFLSGKLSFSKIPGFIEKMLRIHETVDVTELDHVFQIDKEVRLRAQELLKSI